MATAICVDVAIPPLYFTPHDHLSGWFRASGENCDSFPTMYLLKATPAIDSFPESYHQVAQNHSLYILQDLTGS